MVDGGCFLFLEMKCSFWPTDSKKQSYCLLGIFLSVGSLVRNCRCSAIFHSSNISKLFFCNIINKQINTIPTVKVGSFFSPSTHFSQIIPHWIGPEMPRQVCQLRIFRAMSTLEGCCIAICCRNTTGCHHGVALCKTDDSTNRKSLWHSKLQTWTRKNMMHARGDSAQVTTNLCASNRKNIALNCCIAHSWPKETHNKPWRQNWFPPGHIFTISTLTTKYTRGDESICLLHWLKKWLQVTGIQGWALNCYERDIERTLDFMNFVYRSIKCRIGTGRWQTTGFEQEKFVLQVGILCSPLLYLSIQGPSNLSATAMKLKTASNVRISQNGPFHFASTFLHPYYQFSVEAQNVFTTLLHNHGSVPAIPPAGFDSTFRWNVWEFVRSPEWPLICCLKKKKDPAPPDQIPQPIRFGNVTMLHRENSH